MRAEVAKYAQRSAEPEIKIEQGRRGRRCRPPHGGAGHCPENIRATHQPGLATRRVSMRAAQVMAANYGMLSGRMLPAEYRLRLTRPGARLTGVRGPRILGVVRLKFLFLRRQEPARIAQRHRMRFVTARTSDHSMTTSARNRTACGITTPISRAVLRLTANPTLLTDSTGRLAGLVPERTRWTYFADRRPTS